MAQKRMFDRAIIDTDRFMDLPVSAKAFYFLLGMEADDEGFVSYKKVQRIHGGTDDDVKILTAKQFLIMFDSGVVVVTDWNRNNYLDRNRIRPTEYQKEKEKLLLTEQGKYVFNNGLTSIEESSIEERDFSNEKSSFKDEDDTEVEVVETDEDGNELVNRFGKKKGAVKAEGKNKTALSLQHQFADLAYKNCGSRPILDMKGYKMVLYALNTGGLEKEKILDLFDWWFGLGKPDEEAIQITRALSTNSLNTYKVQNNVK